METTLEGQGTIPAPAAAPAPPSKLKVFIVKTIVLTLFGFALGFAQSRASSTYDPKHVAGFWHGFMHGAIMPAALPGLVFGQELSIYAVNNLGRPYNIGFILGLNTCGTLFFGMSFWQPKKK
jgi:hypothetical protein